MMAHAVVWLQDAELVKRLAAVFLLAGVDLEIRTSPRLSGARPSPRARSHNW